MKLFSFCLYLFFILSGDNQIYAANNDLHSNLTQKSFKTTNYIRSSDLSSIKSMTYILPDTIRKVASMNSDSTIVDSNYLPRTKSAIKNKVKYNAKDSIVYLAGEKTTVFI
jgi:hypothetical protein